MLRHFTEKCVESRASKLFMKRCIRLNFKGKGFSTFFSRVLILRYLVLQDIKYCIRPGFVWYLPGPTTTEQSYEFPVSANVGVLFSLDILSQACEKHIERFWSITQPCHVSVHRVLSD